MTTRQEIHPLRTTETMSTISNADLAINADFMLKVAQFLMNFDSNHTNADFDPIRVVKGLAELLEQAIEIYIKNDPDPLDDRHPHRTHPDSAYGNILKIIFRNDEFMSKLVISYILSRDNTELSIQSCRLLLACVPGLDSKVVFSDPADFIPRLYIWANDASNETLQGYAMGLLAAALENPENASKYRMENVQLVEHSLRRLKILQIRQKEEEQEKAAAANENQNGQGTSSSSNGLQMPEIMVTPSEAQVNLNVAPSPEQPPPPKKRRTEPCLSAMVRTETHRVPSYQNLKDLDSSNSKWDILQPFLIGNTQIYPMSLATYQRYILQYLAACGEYQDLLVQTFEGNALRLLLLYIDLEVSKDIRLTFDALKYLTSLLVHRKFALEFLESDGIRALLKLPRASLASVGVVTALYYIAYNADVMEAICQMEDEVVEDIVQYVLWCLEHSYESGKASACMFFSQALYYKTLLKKFDKCDGPRKLYNFIATLTLMQNHTHSIEMTEEQVHTSTQCIRSGCMTFRTYLIAHIYTRVEILKKMYGTVLPNGLRFPQLVQPDSPDYKSMKHYDEFSWECETILHEMNRLQGSTFKEAENVKDMGMIRIFLAVKCMSRDWPHTVQGMRNEMAQHALDCLCMLLTVPENQKELLETHQYNLQMNQGIRILVKSMAGSRDEDVHMRMSAMGCLQRCTFVEPECWKTLENSLKEKSSAHGTPSAKKWSKKLMTSIMSHLEMMWTEVRRADGILVLIDVINSKTPLTEADNLRRFGIKTLSGLARHPEVRQLLSKLPLVAGGELQILMRDPVCADKREEHAEFCKQALALLQIVTGKKMHDHQTKDLPHLKHLSEKMHRQWVVENTKVSFNETELLQLIHNHLEKKGLSSTAAMLKSEAKLPDKPASRTNSTPVRFKPFPSVANNFTQLGQQYPTLAPRMLQSEIGGISARRPSNAASLSSPIVSRSLSHDDEVFATPTLPRRLTGNFPKRIAISPRVKQRPSSAADNFGPKPVKDLDNIIVDHFRTQHASCKNPVATCPPFSLYFPHNCPEKSPKQKIVTNISARIFDADLFRPYHRHAHWCESERTIFSRFRNIKTMHDHDETLTSVTYSVDDEHLIVGMFNGELHWLNVDNGNDESHTLCHHSSITHAEQSKDGSLVLTSSSYVRPLSALWRLGQAMQRMHIYRYDHHMKFSNTSQNKIVGTSLDYATVYDTETNIIVNTYKQEEDMHAARYPKNFASFSPDDTMIYNDGMLWDVRNQEKFIHRFDRLSEKPQIGTFHPFGTQVIIDQDVYDIRTYRLLHHVPEFGQCNFSFNSSGNIMFVYRKHDINANSNNPETFASFRTYDTSDYSALTTFEQRRPLIDFAISHKDQQLCMVEQLKSHVTEYATETHTQLRILEAGRRKDYEENEDEEEERTDERENERVEEEDESTDEENEGGLDDDDDDDDDDLENERGGVFEALGHLGDESEDSDDSSNHSEMNFDDVINSFINRRRNAEGRASSSEGEEPEVPEEPAGEDEAHEGGEDEEEGDPDFDVDEAIDELVDGIRREEDQESDDEGSWRTASQIGSEDINLDELDEDARAQEEQMDVQEEAIEEEEVERSRTSSEDENDEDVIVMRGRSRRRNRHPAHRLHRELMAIEGRRLRGDGPDDIISARVEEQRAQLMEAMRGRERNEAAAAAAAAAAAEDGNMEAEEEMFDDSSSVSTIMLNPTLRRRNRRQRDS